MKGFWETWLHIGTGLLCVGVAVAIVHAIYDFGRVCGRDEVRQTRYETGYKDGYRDRSLGFERQFKPCRN